MGAGKGAASEQVSPDEPGRDHLTNWRACLVLGMKWMFAIASIGLLGACSSLTVPGQGKAVAGGKEAMAVLARSAERTGDPWGKLDALEVGYDGEWTGVVKRLQPVLVDGGHRKASTERYLPASDRISQEHRGPKGSKRVERTRDGVEVSFSDGREVGAEEREAAALVADAYRIFIFGASWLRKHGSELSVLSPVELAGETCDRVQGVLRPGIGFSEEDRFIAWIGRDSGRMQRFQFTIEGLESTRGADVEVTFPEFRRFSDGVELPTRFVERVERPVKVKAHEWWMVERK